MWYQPTYSRSSSFEWYSAILVDNIVGIMKYRTQARGEGRWTSWSGPGTFSTKAYFEPTPLGRGKGKKWSLWKGKVLLMCCCLYIMYTTCKCIYPLIHYMYLALITKYLISSLKLGLCFFSGLLQLCTALLVHWLFSVQRGINLPAEKPHPLSDDPILKMGLSFPFPGVNSRQSFANERENGLVIAFGTALPFPSHLHKVVELIESLWMPCRC